MARKPVNPHRAALTRMLRATGLAQVPEEAPLVELLRTLADEIDAGGGSRPRIEFRNALKDARAVLNAGPARKPKGTAEVDATVKVAESTPADAQPKPNDLAEFKQRRGIGATSPSQIAQESPA